MLIYSYLCNKVHMPRRCLVLELPRVLHVGGVWGEN